jgi:elongation factor 4
MKVLNTWRHLIRRQSASIGVLSADVLTVKGTTFGRPCTSAAVNKNSAIDLSRFPPERIRNFCIIAHIDHGKSTLSDRLLEQCGLLRPKEHEKQFLDRLQVERERGITVKAQAVSLIHHHQGESYLLNLIDTPGHADFSYEVWRSIAVCNAALLLIDAASGVQAQTIAHFNQALLSDLNILPVINKIDLKNARTELVTQQLERLFSFEPAEVLRVSAKTGVGVQALLDAVVEKVAAPGTNQSLHEPFEAYVFDTWHRAYIGLVCLVHVRRGRLSVGDRIQVPGSSKVHEIRSLGLFHPNECSTPHLFAGQVGFFGAHIHDTTEIELGQCIVSADAIPSSEALSSGTTCVAPATDRTPLVIPKAKQMVFAGVFPCDPSQTNALKSALTRLILTDNSVHLSPDTSPALGFGFRLGFLGLLHMEVFCQRLEQDFDAPTVITAPTVPYKVKLKGEKAVKQYGAEVLEVNNPLRMPDAMVIESFEEPMIRATIVSPDAYLSGIQALTMDRRGVLIESQYIDQSTLCMQFRMPLSEVIVDFCDTLKSISSGFASFDYEPDGYEPIDAVRLDFLLNGKSLEEMTLIVPKSKAREIGRRYTSKLKEHLPRQQFKIAIQASIGKKIVAREDISAFRKDVTAKLYGGDINRRKKLLALQAEGKRRMRLVGNVEVSRETLIDVLRK